MSNSINHVLVVDDDPAIRRFCSLVLSVEGFSVEGAEHGQAALEAIERNTPQAVVLDLLMPVMDGRELFRRLEQSGVRPPVVILSAYGAERAQTELGAEASLAKPFEPQSLVDAVRKLISSN